MTIDSVRRLHLVAFAMLLSSGAWAEGGRDDSRLAPEPVETVEGSSLAVLDGDTAALKGKDRIRLLGVDAPETYDSRCERELLLGLKAKKRFAELLAAGPVRIERREKDAFRRTLAYVTLSDGRDVGRTMLEEGLVLPHRPGEEAAAERLAQWCGPPAGVRTNTSAPLSQDRWPSLRTVEDRWDR
jgi:hypothetical protein